MSVTMQLGGFDLGSNFPRFSRDFENIRLDDQGLGAYKKVTITLSGFVEGDSSAEVIDLFNTLKAAVGHNDTTFTYTDTDELNDNAVKTVYSNQKVWIESYQEPDDQEFARNASGDYHIKMHFFEDCDNSMSIACSYGSYTFDKIPKIGRRISPNRSTHRAKLTGSTAEITIEGVLYADSTSSLQSKMASLESAFSTDQNFTYGAFSQPCRVGAKAFAPVTQVNYAPYSITLYYDIGSTVKLSRKVTISRLHKNPVVTEQPFCNNRVIELMNDSAQTINYYLKVVAADLTTCRQQLAIEAALLLSPGGFEWPGGSEVWDYDEVSVEVNFTKFYNDPVVGNLTGTGDS